MEREITIHLDLRLSPRTIIGGLTAALMVGLAGDLGSESVSLTTYYPAPSGVYTQMLTTNSTYLARNAGSVAIGLTDPDSNTKLAVNGSVAVGGAVAALAVPTNGMSIQGRLGIGIADTNPVRQPLQVRGTVHIGEALIAADGVPAGSTKGYLYIDNANTGCVSDSSSSSGAICTGAPDKYATFTPGIYIAGNTYQYRGGPLYADYGSGTTTKVWGWSTANPSGTWMVLGKDDTAANFYCCPK